MSVTVSRVALMACLLTPSLSWALGLGEIHLGSSLNEPMNAEIDLLAAAPDELVALRATLASRDAFTRYGIDRPPFLSSLTFKVGKSKEGRDVLLVHSSEAIPEPFVTFLVEVNWARGRLMREYTVLLDPPVYTPGERASSAAPVAAASSGAGEPSRRTASPVVPMVPGTAGTSGGSAGRAARSSAQGGAADATGTLTGNSYRVGEGDTLAKIARSLHSTPPAQVDQTMIAIYRSNPEAFGGNINILKRGAVLRVPGADDIASLNQSEAMSEVHRQMGAWRDGGTAAPSGHLRLVTPGAGGSAKGKGTGAGDGSAATAETQALKDRVKDLEGQLTDKQRLLDIKSNELSALQRKLGVPVTPPPVPPASVATPPAVSPPVAATPAPDTAASTATDAAASAAASTASPPVEAAASAPLPATAAKPPAAAPAESGTWLDWVTANWWLPAAVIVALLLAALGFNALRRRRGEGGDFPGYHAGEPSNFDDPSVKFGRADSFVVEESGEHPLLPDSALGSAERFGATAEPKLGDDTVSTEGAVNLDQGDPLAEADFHMAYGLYDQAADLVRIALEREPERRDLRLKLLEIYFVWGNKDQFLQTAKTLESTRDQAPVGEWDKIVIMGKQIAPEDPLFSATSGSGRGAGALVDLNLEGGENRVDIDLFGEPEGEHDRVQAKVSNDTADTGNPPRLNSGDDIDFMLDAPERGADESPTREMPKRDEPTVESELMHFDATHQETPALRSVPPAPKKVDQTAEVSLDDLGLDLEALESQNDVSISIPRLDEENHPADAPTMIAGLDDRSRRMMADADSRARDQDLTSLERELEASFVADLGNENGIKTEVISPESASTEAMPRGAAKQAEFSDIHELDKPDTDSTSRLRGINSDSIDLDLDRLASALGSTDTLRQPRAEDDLFSSEVFEHGQDAQHGVDLDVGEALHGSDGPTNRMTAIAANGVDKHALPLHELEPVTMSEVGTKLDLARAYMDMGDPEGARSILEEVVTEGSASQKQEAQRLIEALPG